VFWKARSLVAVAPAYLYLAYLFLDYLLLPQSRFIKWMRNGSSVVFVLVYGPVVLGALGLPDVPAEVALLAVLLGAGLAYLYERGPTVQGFTRGFVLAAGLELLSLLVAPTGLGPHVALTVFAAAYAWERHTVFWRYSVPFLLSYPVAITGLLAGGVELFPHVLVGLVAWLASRLIPYDRSAPVDPDAPLGLGLRL
jgi:hypothetical protein